MYTKTQRIYIYTLWAKSISLLLILLVSFSSLNTPLYPKKAFDQALRPASNGTHRTPLSFEQHAPPSRSSSAGKPVEGATTKVVVPEGVVEVKFKGRSFLVPAGDTLVPELYLLRASSSGERTGIPPGFQGGPLDVIHGQFLAYHMALQELVGQIPGLTKNKYIEFNTDFLPDFDPGIDSPQKRLVEAVLEAVAHRIVQYKRGRDFGWADNKRIYLDFVSRIGNKDKNDRIKAIFTPKKMQVVKAHRLDELLRSAPADTEKSDKIIITYAGDTSALEHPSLFLETELMTNEKIRAYALHTIIDLAVVTLTVDRTAKEIREEPGYAIIRELFRYLLKDKVNLTDELLDRFLSNDPEVVKAAALELALPPVREVDFEAIEDIYRMTIEAAKWA